MSRAGFAPHSHCSTSAELTQNLGEPTRRDVTWVSLLLDKGENEERRIIWDAGIKRPYGIQ